ncbi:MAG: hypothetical protein Q9193_004433 [Seirophora villosa]
MSSPKHSTLADPEAPGLSAPDLASEEDAAILAKLGYKQELRRNFTMIEIFGISFSIMGLLPSIASVLVYSIPAGPVGMQADLGSAMPTSGGLYWWTHFFASPSTRNPLSFLVGYSNTLGLVGGLCSIDCESTSIWLNTTDEGYSFSSSDGFSLMFLSVIVIARDGNWTPSNGVIYATYLATVLCHAGVATVSSKIMGKLQTVFVVMNFLVIAATIIALPIGARYHRNSGHYIFAETANLTTWPTGWTFMLSWLAPIWTIGSFDSCVHLSEEATRPSKAVPFGILTSIGSCWFFGFIIMIVLAATINPDLESVTGTSFGQPMAQIYYDAVGKNGTMGLMCLLFITQFLMGISIIVAASRQTWAFSRDGALPFSAFFRPISQRFGFIPLRAVWGCAFLAVVLGLLTLIAPAAAQALFSLTVAGNNLAWGVPIFARVVWGQEKFVPGPFYTGDHFSVPVAWTAIVFLVFGTLLAMFPVEGPSPTPQSMNYTVVISAAVWIGALTYYYVDAWKWFTGPKITIPEEQQVALEAKGLESLTD